MQQVELVAAWADLHAGESPAGPQMRRGDVLPGSERSVQVGGDGTPRVREFAATELGVLLGTTTNAARGLLRDVLDLRHRHPRLWETVRTGRARFWQARQVVRHTRDHRLDRDQARWADARTAPHLGLVPWGRMLGVVEAATIEADPEGAEQRRLTEQLARFVRTGQCDDYGIKTLYARVEAGDAIFFLAMCDRIAQLLADRGDEDSTDVRRAKAVGILATPARALALLQQGQEPDGREDAAQPDGLAVTPSPVVVIDGSVPPERFAPPAVLYVHLTLEQLLQHDGHSRGAARVEDVGPVTVAAAVDLLRHARVRLQPVIDCNDHWAVDGYRIPPRMREHVALTEPVEVFPHGTLASRRAEMDHVVPYDPDGPPGQTSTTNLAPLSRHHHRVKTHGQGWVHRQVAPGIAYWRTPQGYWAKVDRSGTHLLGRSQPPADRTLLDEDASPVGRRLAGLLLDVA